MSIICINKNCACHITIVCGAVLALGCVEGDVRLLEGESDMEGRVEVCKRNIWGTICHNGWGVTDANVICRQLGFSSVGNCILMTLFKP